MLTPKKKRNPRWVKVFLEVLRGFPSVTEACRTAGVSRQRVYQFRECNSSFANEWKEAISEGCDALEAEAIRRAMIGTEHVKPHIFGGKVVFEELIRKKSDLLLMFLLKGHKPGAFKHNIMKVEKKHVDKKTNFSLDLLSPKLRKAIIDEIREHDKNLAEDSLSSE